MRKSLFVLSIIALVFLGAFGCSKDDGEKSTAGSKAAGGKIKIGLSFSDFATERWTEERDKMTKMLEDKGYEVIAQGANHDPKTQNDQIENMVTQGAKVILIVAEDGAATSIAVDKAARAGVPCIAYDRLIKTTNVACYISFDNVEVGRQQAQGVLKVRDSGRFVLLGGSPTDNNAVLFRNGQMEVLQPLIDKGQIQIVADQWVDNWEQEIALKKMENILTKLQNNIDAVVASNDNTALGAIQALKAQKLNGKIPISGQDASLAGCRSIVDGDLTMTVYKDYNQLVPLAIDIAIKLATGEKIEGLQNFSLAELSLEPNLKGEISCKFIKVVQVDKNNIYDVIVKSGVKPWEEVYAG
ncbi:MAG: substrate-binding domain-containing protein, partial [Deltaproteobacteria bacterium]|nr:substrate-binding domain-containing protein [Deltaproteobacteria bacterium]